MSLAPLTREVYDHVLGIEHDYAQRWHEPTTLDIGNLPPL